MAAPFEGITALASFGAFVGSIWAVLRSRHDTERDSLLADLAEIKKDVADIKGFLRGKGMGF